eukprot:Awhi_evm6s5220
MTENYIKCAMCKSLKHIDNEYIIVKDKRLKTCNGCRERQKINREKYKCVHNKRKERCVKCGGSNICEHNKCKERCVECGGSSVCEHNRRRSDCVECDGSSICEHKRIRSTCKECNGSDCMTPEQQIKYTLKNMIYSSKRTDDRKEILDYYTFIDLDFLYVLLEDYPDMKCHYGTCETIMEFNPDDKMKLISIERKENVIEGVHQPHSKNNVR